MRETRWSCPRSTFNPGNFSRPPRLTLLVFWQPLLLPASVLQLRCALQKTDTLEAEGVIWWARKARPLVPHKRNPLLLRRSVVCPGVVKANAQVAFDNVVLARAPSATLPSALPRQTALLLLDQSKLEFLLDGMVLYPEQDDITLTRPVACSSRQRFFLPWSTLVLLAKRRTRLFSPMLSEGLGRYPAVQGGAILTRSFEARSSLLYAEP